nr:hypothetical protein [uncultured Noviherbaspirillum sp.]
MKIPAWRVTSPLILPLFLLPLPSAADPSGLSGSAPLRVEDAEPTSYRSKELEISSSYERTGEGDRLGEFQPEFKYGFAQDAHVSIASPKLFGSAPHTGSGDISLTLFSRLYKETGTSWWPSIAVSARAELPTGSNSRGVDTRLAFIASRSLAGSAGRVHFNGLWHRNARAEPGDRKNRYGVIFGYSHALTQERALVADYIHEQQDEPGKVDKIAEIGLRQALGPKDVIGVGAGAGLNSESPRYRVVVSYQHAF